MRRKNKYTEVVVKLEKSGTSGTWFFKIFQYSYFMLLVLKLYLQYNEVHKTDDFRIANELRLIIDLTPEQDNADACFVWALIMPPSC